MLSSDGLKGKKAWVEVTRVINGLDGEPVEVGDKIELTLSAAHEAVHNGTAVFCEAPVAGAKKAGAGAKKAEGEDK